MKVLILNTDYRNFLNAVYGERPDLVAATYAEQLEVRNNSRFGVADYYSRNLQELGHEAEELHVNNWWLQYAWARENGVDVGVPREPGRFSPRELIRGAYGVMKKTVPTSLLQKALPTARRMAQTVRSIGLSSWEAAVLQAQIESFDPD